MTGAQLVERHPTPGRPVKEAVPAATVTR
jgi:hypothetical protein